MFFITNDDKLLVAYSLLYFKENICYTNEKIYDKTIFIKFELTDSFTCTTFLVDMFSLYIRLQRTILPTIFLFF